MKYKIERHDPTRQLYNIHTDFIITEILEGLLEKTKGIEQIIVIRYKAQVNIGQMFDNEKVVASMTKVIEAYLAANKNLDYAEDRQLEQFAIENEQFNFLKNFKKGNNNDE